MSVGLIRRWFHLRLLGHRVCETVTRDFRVRSHYAYRRGWHCVECRLLWT